VYHNSIFSTEVWPQKAVENWANTPSLHKLYSLPNLAHEVDFLPVLASLLSLGEADWSKNFHSDIVQSMLINSFLLPQYFLTPKAAFGLNIHTFNGIPQ